MRTTRTKLLATVAFACTACAPAAPGLPVAQGGDAWVERTLASLTLREKVGQMMMPWVLGDFVAADSPEMQQLIDWVERDGVGGVVMSMGMPLEYAAKLNALQARARVPLLVASDMENGPGMRMAGIYSFPHLLPMGGGTAFPPVMAVGATGSDTLAYELGRVLAREARAVGVHVVFGPVVDVNSNPLNPIINTRSFGEDPVLVGRLAAAYIRGARAGGLQTTAKHFPGHGDTEVDSHLDLPAIRADRTRLDRVELVPFRSAVAAGTAGVMTAHIAVTGVEGENAPPATLSSHFMTDVLRGELGFDGLLFTDAMRMAAIAKHYGGADAIVRAVDAGADVVLMPADIPEAVAALVEAVASGRLTEARIDESVRRILEAKARAGLPATRIVDVEAVADSVGIAPHRQLARTIAERAITLARDDRALVPLPASARRVLLVTFAESRDPISGGTFADALRGSGLAVEEARVDERTSETEFRALSARADAADVVIVAAFASPLEGAGTVAVRGGVARWASDIARLHPVLVASFGSPYLISAFGEEPSYLLAWGGADVAQEAAARALTGAIPITGTLPVSVPPALQRGTGIVRATPATSR